MIKYILALILTFTYSVSYATYSLSEENKSITAVSEQLLPLYDLAPNQTWKDITTEVFNHSTTSELTKQAIQENHRRIILFRYPSDGLQIKGLLSFTPQSSQHPLLLVFRGGTQTFGLLNPGSEWLSYGDYISISSTLRGGVSEGKDEYGGADVNDIKNMLDYLPILASQVGLSSLPSTIHMLGISRGGLEMFLTLERFPELQTRVTKVVALSAILDIRQQIIHRPEDMGKMFKEEFGLKGLNDKGWISQRNPLDTVPYLRKNLPVFIVQGTADPRIQITEAHHMVTALRQANHCVDYWESEGGNHGLTNDPMTHSTIFNWFNASSTC